MYVCCQTFAYTSDTYWFKSQCRCCLNVELSLHLRIVSIKTKHMVYSWRQHANLGTILAYHRQVACWHPWREAESKPSTEQISERWLPIRFNDLRDLQTQSLVLISFSSTQRCNMDLLPRLPWVHNTNDIAKQLTDAKQVTVLTEPCPTDKHSRRALA